GILWDAYRDAFGQDGADPFVWQAGTMVMNPTFREAVIRKALAKDPAKASAEYLAQFREDLESYVSQELVDRAVIPGRTALPPVAGTVYCGFVDPAGGSGR